MTPSFYSGRPAQQGVLGQFGNRGIMYAQGPSQPVAPPASAPPSTPSTPSSPYTNPYLSSQINNLGQQYGQQFQRSVLPAIRDSAIANGGYGGTAQGVAEGIAGGDMMRSFGQQATGLLGQDWSDSQNRQLTNQWQMLNFATGQRSQDLSSLQTGASLYGAGTQGMWGPINSAQSVYGQYTGFPTTTTSQGGGLNGLLGGAIGGSALAKNLGWGSSGTPNYGSGFDPSLFNPSNMPGNFGP